MKLMSRLSLCVLAAFLTISAFAQKHILEVGRFKDWGKDYLTITYGGFGIEKKNPDTAVALFWDRTDGIYPTPGAVIMSINGESTLEMSIKRFYEIVDTCSTVTLSYLDNRYSTMTKSSDDFHEYYRHTNLLDQLSTSIRNRYRNDYSENEAQLKELGITYTELIDSDYDWAGKTYDFKLSDEHAFEDKMVLQALPLKRHIHFDRRTDNPDILFSINQEVMNNGYRLEIIATDVQKSIITDSDQIIWKLSFHRKGSLPDNIIEEWINLASSMVKKLPFIAHHRHIEGHHVKYDIETKGNVVQWVKEGSSAAAAGLCVGDIIVAIDWIEGNGKSHKRDDYSDNLGYIWSSPENITITKCKIIRKGNHEVIKNSFKIAYFERDYMVPSWE